MEKHSFIVTYKTAFYSFYLPVALAMYMAGMSSEEDLKQAKDILIPLGEYFPDSGTHFLPSVLMVGRLPRLLRRS